MRDARSGRYRSPSHSIRDYSPRLSLHYRSTCTDVHLFYLPVYKCTCATYLARYGIADGNGPLNLKRDCLSVRTRYRFCLITWTFCEWAWSLRLITITTIYPLLRSTSSLFNDPQLSPFDDLLKLYEFKIFGSDFRMFLNSRFILLSKIIIVSLFEI